MILAEGYTAAEQEKFRSDAERAVSWLFSVEPYRSRRKDFNVYGVFRPSPESGVSEPTRHVVKRTALGASFDALGMPRYLLAEDGWRMRAMADEAPCDDVVVLVNTDRYGGGGIYNDTCIFAADNERSRMLFLHEFGHAFAGLADEYIDPETVYSDTYPKGVEPLEPNITAWLDPAELKWKAMVSPGVALPDRLGRGRHPAAVEKGRGRPRRVPEGARQGARPGAFQGPDRGHGGAPPEGPGRPAEAGGSGAGQAQVGGRQGRALRGGRLRRQGALPPEHVLPHGDQHHGRVLPRLPPRHPPHDRLHVRKGRRWTAQ